MRELIPQLKDRVALITGSSRGIGAGIARVLAGQGANVAIHGRDPSALATVRGEIEHAGGHVISVAADVTKFSDIETMRREIENQLGPVDILVANAGGSFTKPAPLEDISDEGWRVTVAGNLDATFLTIKSFLPGMKERRSGCIITVSSAAARRPHPNSPIPYAAAKAGIIMMTQHLAAQVGPYNIRVNCIAPETILTENNRVHIPMDQQATLAESHPLKRLGTVEDIAHAALYLASDNAGWVTGTVLDVAGGAVMV